MLTIVEATPRQIQVSTRVRVEMLPPGEQNLYHMLAIQRLFQEERYSTNTLRLQSNERATTPRDTTTPAKHATFRPTQRTYGAIQLQDAELHEGLCIPKFHLSNIASCCQGIGIGRHFSTFADPSHNGGHLARVIWQRTCIKQQKKYPDNKPCWRNTETWTITGKVGKTTLHCQTAPTRKPQESTFSRKYPSVHLVFGGKASGQNPTLSWEARHYIQKKRQGPYPHHCEPVRELVLVL